MKTYINPLYICLFIAGLLACTQHKNDPNELEPQTFEQQAKNTQGILLDVRTPEEYNEGHLSGAINIDYKADNFEAALGQLDKDKPYYIYCKSGVRSGNTVTKMQKMGFTQVYNMDGGVEAWKAEGLPLQK